MECLSSEDWLKRFSSKDKILLINPPVHEIRYAWVRWNQPSELLLLSSRLKQEVGCEVELLDFMLPFDNGRVPMRDLAKQKVIGKEKTVFKSRIYGLPLEEATRSLQSLLSEWKPSHIIISTLTTYWFESLVTLVPYLKTFIPSAQVSLIGPYPVYEVNHAKRINADYIVTDFIALEDYLPDFELYFGERTRRIHEDRVINFGGLKFTKRDTAKNLIAQVKVLIKYNIRDFVVFEENLFVNGCTVIDEFLDLLERENLKINLHGLCGFHISDAVDQIFVKMYKNGYRSFYIEYDLDGSELNIDNYLRVYHELVLNDRVRLASGNLAGFLMIGTPQDDLERMFKHSFNILEICGSIIPKPYTPSIKSIEYRQISDSGKLDLLSPHVFPLAEKTGISRKDYIDFHKHTAFLNEKRMGSSFDFFDESYCSIALRRSLSKKGVVIS